MTRLLLAAMAAAAAACTGSEAPHATAYRIGALEETIGGPHAIGRVGDFLLENDQIRLIVADKGPGRVNLPFGGSLVDADLQRPGGPQNGNDQLAELLPGVMFVGLDPTDVEVTHDGSDGYLDGVAEVDVTGNGNDLLQMIGLLDAGLVFPSDLQLTQAYRLHPGKRYVEIVTTIKNTSSGAHPFPYLNPSQLANTGLGSIPGIDTLQLSVPMGQLPLLGGEQELFAPGVAGFNVHFAITDSYGLAKGFPSFPGMVVDFLASRGRGVSYGLTVPAAPTNYVTTFASGYSNQKVTPYSMLIPFTYAGVSAVYSTEPPEQLNAGESFSFTSYFVVGTGDVGSILDTIYDLRGTATGTFGGSVIDSQTSAVLAGASVIINDDGGNPFDQVTTDATGSFLAHLAPGNYSYQVVADDHLTTAPVPFTVAAGAQTGVQIQVAPPGTIAVSVVDETGRHAPCKVLLVGHFDDSHLGQDPRTFLYSFKLGEKMRTTAFDPTSDAFVEGAWWTKDGRLAGSVRPGTYDLVVSRGPEYELHTEQVTIPPGGFAESEIVLQRAFATDGWVAGDFHLHAQASTDSGVPNDQRVISAAAEGLDVATSTDHNFVTDYTPAIAANALDTWLLGISGLELTTFEMGHFIGFPLKVDPGSTRGGEFVWAGQKPQKLFDQLHHDLALFDGQSIVDIAHPRQQVLGYFAQFFVDAATAAPYTPTGILGVFAPYGDEFRPENFSYDFDALEVITNNHFEDIHTFVAPDPATACGSAAVPGQVVVGKDGRPTFPGVVETWFTMLDHGLMPTAMGASDSHRLLGDEPGYARTLVYVGQGKDHPGEFGRDDVVSAIKAHRTVATNAPMIEMTIANGMIGDTVVAHGQVMVNVHVHAPSWAKVDRVKLYQGNGGAVVADLPVPAAQGTDFQTTATLTVSADTWVVAEATGSQNMFPINSAVELPPLDATIIIQALGAGFGSDLATLPIASACKPIRQHQSTPYAITNPIWIDADGGGWTPPLAPITKDTHPPRPPAPDVRAAFEALPEVSE